jgi:hypothetical protein
MGMPMSDPTASTPLSEAKAWLRARLRDGATCPCCSQRAQTYRRKITATSARALVTMYRKHGLEVGHLPTALGRKQADEAKMVYWGLIEDEGVLRDDGGRAGYWRVTDKGLHFMQGRLTIQKYALVYDSRCLGFEGPQVSFSQCLGETFDLRDLLDGR